MLRLSGGMVREIVRRLNMDVVPSRWPKLRAAAIKRICERSEG